MSDKIESLFVLENIDHKNITNKSDMVVSQADLDKIENQGVTLEFLEAMNVPVFKYKTQITIHGLFPQLERSYIGGYKRLFQNKNLSIGVKWDAVDFDKKKKIYDSVVGFLDGWKMEHNSTKLNIYKNSIKFNTRSEYVALLPQVKAEMAHINAKLFYGHVGINLCPLLYGGYVIETYIHIGAIAETNVIPCIENVCQASIVEIEAKIQADKDAKEKYWADEKAKRDAEREALRIASQPNIEKAKEVLTSAGYVFQDGCQLQKEIF